MRQNQRGFYIYRYSELKMLKIRWASSRGSKAPAQVSLTLSRVTHSHIIVYCTIPPPLPTAPPPLKKGNSQMGRPVQDNPAAPTPFHQTLRILLNTHFTQPFLNPLLSRLPVHLNVNISMLPASAGYSRAEPYLLGQISVGGRRM